LSTHLPASQDNPKSQLLSVKHICGIGTHYPLLQIVFAGQFLVKQGFISVIFLTQTPLIHIIPSWHGRLLKHKFGLQETQFPLIQIYPALHRTTAQGLNMMGVMGREIRSSELSELSELLTHCPKEQV
jgi:hypothetical protein